MDVKTAIKKRKSIRKYKNKKISKKIINELIEAARLAPSAKNIQPWMFKIITNEKIKNKLKKEEIFKQDFVYTAPLIIVCCAEQIIYPKRKPNKYSNILLKERIINDLGIASQNLILRATELGLGTCYIGLMQGEKIKKILKIPKHYFVPYSIAVGYADEKGLSTTRKKEKKF